MNRPRDKQGRFISIGKARAAKLADLQRALPAFATAIGAESPSNKVVSASIYSMEVRFSKPQSWARLIRIFLDTDLKSVKRYNRIRYLIAARNTEGDVRPLSRAYAEPELTLGEAIATLEGETVLSPKEGDDDIGDTMWKAIICNCYLRKDAMR
jgi:hypothetical protein